MLDICYNYLQILVDTAIICVANNEQSCVFVLQNYEYVHMSQSHNCNIIDTIHTYSIYAQLNRLN